MTSALLKLLSEMDENDDDAPANILPEAAIITLKEVSARYSAPCPFAAGDIVTPRKGCNLKSVGLPHVVLEVLEKPIRIFDAYDVGDIGSNAFGARIDIRVAAIIGGGSIVPHAVESWMFEPFYQS